MAQSDNKKGTLANVKGIKPNTPEMEAFLALGYGGMTVEKAQTIIKERKENPASWPYSELQRAEAFLAAYKSKPQVISTRPPFDHRREAQQPKE